MGTGLVSNAIYRHARTHLLLSRESLHNYYYIFYLLMGSDLVQPKFSLWLTCAQGVFNANCCVLNSFTWKSSIQATVDFEIVT